jgi:hypothetical protein
VKPQDGCEELHAMVDGHGTEAGLRGEAMEAERALQNQAHDAHGSFRQRPLRYRGADYSTVNPWPVAALWSGGRAEMSAMTGAMLNRRRFLETVSVSLLAAPLVAEA